MAGFQIVCLTVVQPLLGARAGLKEFCLYGWLQPLAGWQLFLWLGCSSMAHTWALVQPELNLSRDSNSLQDCGFRQFSRAFFDGSFR